jgi:hypothetical protein
MLNCARDSSFGSVRTQYQVIQSCQDASIPYHIRCGVSSNPSRQPPGDQVLSVVPHRITRIQHTNGPTTQATFTIVAQTAHGRHVAHVVSYLCLACRVSNVQQPRMAKPLIRFAELHEPNSPEPPAWRRHHGSRACVRPAGRRHHGSRACVRPAGRRHHGSRACVRPAWRRHRG